MSDFINKYNDRLQREQAMFEERCRKTAYALARKMVKEQLESINIGEQRANQLMENKVELVKKYAKRLLPKVREVEASRRNAFHTGSKIENLGQVERKEINEDINDSFSEAFGANTQQAKDAQDNQQLKGTPGPQSITQKTTVRLQRNGLKKQPPVVFNPPDKRIEDPRSKSSMAIQAKSSDAHIPGVILREVFTRGVNSWNEQVRVTPEQYGFARVNSFINQGKSYKELDSDLVDLITLDESILLGLAAMGGAAAGAGAVGAAVAGGSRLLQKGINRLTYGKPGGPTASGAGTSQTALHGTAPHNNTQGLPSNDTAGNKVRDTMRSTLVKGAVGGIKSVLGHRVSGGAYVASEPSQNVGMMPPSGLRMS